MTGRIALVATCVAALSGCVAAGSVIKPTAQISITPAMARQIENGVKRGLKDPESARFGSTAAGQSPDGFVVVCGYVNAKNSFGGYTGAQPYYGLLQGNRFHVVAFGSDEASVYAVTRQCTGAKIMPVY